jgi:hypothetical protein
MATSHVATPKRAKVRTNDLPSTQINHSVFQAETPSPSKHAEQKLAVLRCFSPDRNTYTSPFLTDLGNPLFPLQRKNVTS